jgi:hypothetical protein
MTQQINLFNPIFLKQKKYFSAVTMLQGLGMILFGAVALGGYARYQLYELGKEVDATKAQVAVEQGRLKKVMAEYAPKKKDKGLDEQIMGSGQEADSLLQVFALLDGGALGSTNGYAEYMRAFARQITQGVWLTGFQIRGAGHDIVLQGRALQAELVPAYISRLSNEPVLQGKSFAALELQSPPPEVPGKGPAVAVQRVSPAYLNFELRSSDAVKEQKAEQRAPALYAQSTAYLEFQRALAELKDKSDSVIGAKSK